jgi:glutathione S-transferase
VSLELKLYSNPLTANGIKMRLILKAISIEAEVINLQLHKGEQKSSEFLKVNPAGKIPVLIDGVNTLTESNAILHYLANKHESTLWPSDNQQQSQVLAWLFWQSSVWTSAVSSFAHQRLVLPYWGFKGRDKMDSESIENFHRAAKHLDDSLRLKSALVGDQLSIADISLASYLIFSEQARIPLTPYVHLNHWLSHLNDFSWWTETRLELDRLLNH